MKTLITPEFKEKASLISKDSVALLNKIINFCESSSKETILHGISSYHVLPIGDIYVVLAGYVQIYFTFGTDEEGEYVLLMDIAETQKEPIKNEYFAQKNPVTNHLFNPAYNTSINPNYNTSINPHYNTSINPHYNYSINPNYNHSINPNYNHSINPNYNHSINPAYNRGFGGPYLYSKGLAKEGYLVKANENTNLIYNMQNKHIAITVVHRSKVQLVYDDKLKWISYLIPTKKDPILRFDLRGSWIGMIL